MERDPNIEIERNPARRSPVVERTAPTLGPQAAPLAVRHADRVEWGPIWAGFFVSMLSLLVLGSLAAAIGLAAVAPGQGAVTPSLGTGITALLITLVALFLGGLTTGYLMEALRKGWGALNGVVLAGLVLTLTLLFSAAGTLRVGNVIGNVLAGMNVGYLQDPNAMMQGATPEQIAASAATAAGWFTVISLLSIGAAALGGWVGVKAERRETVRTHA